MSNFANMSYTVKCTCERPKKQCRFTKIAGPKIELTSVLPGFRTGSHQPSKAAETHIFCRRRLFANDTTNVRTHGSSNGLLVLHNVVEKVRFVLRHHRLSPSSCTLSSSSMIVAFQTLSTFSRVEHALPGD